MNNYGIVYDIKKDRAVVLTQNSSFVMIRRREDMFLGQKIFFDDKDISDSEINIISTPP